MKKIGLIAILFVSFVLMGSSVSAYHGFTIIDRDVELREEIQNFEGNAAELLLTLGMTCLMVNTSEEYVFGHGFSYGLNPENRMLMDFSCDRAGSYFWKGSFVWWNPSGTDYTVVGLDKGQYFDYYKPQFFMPRWDSFVPNILDVIFGS